uniref:Zinc metalloproteinase n=1 Tax=Haemonchus contortus TaxID=6289 RepID=A0A7I4Y364_HAECO
MRIISLILLSVLTLTVNSTTTINNEEFIDNAEVAIIDRIRNIENETRQTFHLTPKAKETLQVLEQLPTIKHDHFNPEGDYIDEINKKAKIDKKLFQGDIYLNEVQGEIIIEELVEELEGTNRTKRQAIRDRDGVRLWNNFTVNYIFNATLSKDAKEAFLKGANMWTKDTCIRFQHHNQLQHITDVETLKRYVQGQDLLIVQAKGGCWSSLGKAGGLQQISLAAACETNSIAAHEIGHTLGFYHTMSRHDRNDHIIVNGENIQNYWVSQFEWKSSDMNDNFGLDYDYGSIMHYRASDAAINPALPTLIPYDKDYRKTLGSPFVSFIDALMLNKLYGCDKLCDKSGIEKVECQNGGYPHPLNCSKCVCPGGYTGAQCDKRPNGRNFTSDRSGKLIEGCGQTFDASTEWQNFTDFLGDYAKSHENYAMCYYWIQSPENTEIEIELVSFSDEHALEGCPNAGVEIKTNRNQQLTGYRFCSPRDAGTKLRSYTNRVPIITWNRAYISQVVLRYRHVPKNEPRPTTVRPTTRSTTWPTPTTIATTTHAVEEQQKCDDRPECPLHIANGFCYREGITYEQRKAYCPRGCRLCDE